MDDHVSESEFKGRDLGLSSAAEDAHRLFESEFEGREEAGRFLNAASTNLNLNDFVPASELIYQEAEALTANRGEFTSRRALQVQYATEPKLVFPDTLRVYLNPRGVLGHEAGLDSAAASDSDEGDDSDEEARRPQGELHCFPHPTLNRQLKVWNYYVMDAASVLPVLCLDVQPGQVVADYCAAPGGKALALLLSRRPGRLLLNDESKSRFHRLKNVIAGYVPRQSELSGVVDFMESDGRQLIRPEQFDRVLLDVPCSNDRVSVTVNESSLFNHNRLKERLALPDKQTELLLAGLRSLKTNGQLVYSTCSLSPIQNDAVVESALRQMDAKSNMQFEVRQLKETLRPLRGLFRFHSFHYGEQVLPFLPSNGGPLYISKIVRIA